MFPGNVDFVISAQSVTLSATQLTDCVTVAIIDDFIQEGSEQFSVVLTTSTPEATVIDGTAPVTIIDNDNGEYSKSYPNTFETLTNYVFFAVYSRGDTSLPTNPIFCQ